MLEHLRAQLARDSPHLLERLADGRLRLVAPALALELEQHAREHLADLVVQAARDSRALGLLRPQGARTALAPLRLQPVEHLVEDVNELTDLPSALLHEPLSRSQQVDRPHPLHEPLDRPQRVAKQQEVRGEHDGEADRDVRAFDEREGRVDSLSRQEDDERRDHEQRRVDREDPPQERKPGEAHRQVLVLPRIGCGERKAAVAALACGGRRDQHGHRRRGLQLAGERPPQVTPA